MRHFELISVLGSHVDLKIEQNPEVVADQAEPKVGLDIRLWKSFTILSPFTAQEKSLKKGVEAFCFHP